MHDMMPLLTELILSVRFCKNQIRECTDLAYQTSLQNALSVCLQEADGFERDLLGYAQSINVYFDSLPPYQQVLSILFTRVMLQFRCSDSYIAEILIQRITKSMIRVQKTANCFQSGDDLRADYLIHRFMRYSSSAIRNLQQYL